MALFLSMIYIFPSTFWKDWTDHVGQTCCVIVEMLKKFRKQEGLEVTAGKLE